jgi:hypothetical protein
LWNERDPILKERLYGLTNSEGNHGEEVKEYYFYVDSTPTHSYMKYLYKYPQGKFPYGVCSRQREAITRGVRVRTYRHRRLRRRPATFDVFMEYAKEGPEDVLIRITVHNSWAGSGPALDPADALVPQHLVVGRG